MRSISYLVSFVLMLVFLVCFLDQEANAQAFGVELHNNLMPASGAMGGASLARPQDVQSAINGNPATMARLKGTNFGFSGAWAEPTFKLKHTPPPGGILPGILGGFEGKSSAPGSVLGNIAVTQDLRELGVPGTVGIGLISSAGLGSSFRHIPESNGTSALLAFLDITAAAGFELTENLSAGASMRLGTGTLDGPFVGLTAASTDYGLRGSVGLNYDINPETTLGAYYQTIQSYNFADAATLSLSPGKSFTTGIDVDLPDNVGIGIANESLMCGKLLLAADILFKQWSNTDLFRQVYDDQWVYQFGAQYTVTDSVKVRLGYTYADNITKSNVGISAGGVTPVGGQAVIRYIQAQFPAFNRHRISGGFSIKNVLPNIDLDLFAGGMFKESQDYGDFTSVSLSSYWIGSGLTWRFGG
jgi:long-chain fatty acid transport protein